MVVFLLKMCGVIWERVDNKRSHLFIICCTDNLFGKMNQSSMKEGTNSRQQPERTSESSSFKQIIRGVESLVISADILRLTTRKITLFPTSNWRRCLVLCPASTPA